MAKKNEYINEQLKYENQDEFNRLIQRTREKKVLWHISRISRNLVEYAFEENGYKAFLSYNKKKGEYKIENIACIDTYDMCKTLEKAILDAEHQEPFHPDEHKQVVHSQEIQRKKQGAPKEKSQKKNIVLPVTSTNKKSGSQQIPKKTENKSIKPANVQAIDIKKREEAIRQEKQRREALENELNSILMSQYIDEDGKKYLGIEILSMRSSMRDLEQIRDIKLSNDVKEFSEKTSEFLEKIDSGMKRTPEMTKLYQQLISEYVRQYSRGKSKLSSGDINKYVRRLHSLQGEQEDLQKTKALKESSKSEDSNNQANLAAGAKRKQKVGTRDFVIRTSVLSCMYKQHSIVNIDAVIKTVDHTGVISDRIVPAGYCQQCQKFFILEDDFRKLNVNVELLCNVIEEKSYRKNYNRKNYFDNLSEWPEQSILRKCGYTVSQAAGLSDPERWRILANVIDHEVLSKIEIQSHIRKQKSLHAKHELAIDKWQSDDDFVSGYNKGYYAKYGVVMLKR